MGADPVLAQVKIEAAGEYLILKIQVQSAFTISLLWVSWNLFSSPEGSVKGNEATLHVRQW